MNMSRKDEDGNVTLREEARLHLHRHDAARNHAGRRRGRRASRPMNAMRPSSASSAKSRSGPKEHRRLIPIITDEYPDPDFGSGAVKITGAHDFNDYRVAKRGGIPMYRLMDTKGAMRADGAPYAEEAAKAQAIANGAREFDRGRDRRDQPGPRRPIAASTGLRRANGSSPTSPPRVWR